MYALYQPAWYAAKGMKKRGPKLDHRDSARTTPQEPVAIIVAYAQPRRWRFGDCHA